MRWCNAPKIFVDSEKKANSLALHHLNSGADGVFFHLQKKEIDAKALLKNIELTYCSVFFESDSAEFLIDLVDFAEIMNGAYFSRNPQVKLKPARFKDCRNFRFCGVVTKQNENIVDEIVDSLLAAVEIIDRLTDDGFSNEQAFRAIAFLVYVNTDFFLSIAKLRTLRKLWATLQQAYPVGNPVPVFIHVHSLPWIQENYQPNGNMLKQTTAAMAAVIGGCEALTIEPEIAENKMMDRVARNVPSMLREESQLAHVNDPLAGSYYMDAITDQIAAEAWKKIQQS